MDYIKNEVKGKFWSLVVLSSIMAFMPWMPGPWLVDACMILFWALVFTVGWIFTRTWYLSIRNYWRGRS